MVNGDEVLRRGATLKRVFDLPWWAPVFDSGTRTGGQRAEERWGRGGPIRVHGDGRQALWRFRRKTVTYPGKAESFGDYFGRR